MVTTIVSQYRRITIEELLRWDREIDVTRNVEMNDLVDAIVNVERDINNASCTVDVNSDIFPAPLGSVQEQLEAIARVKCILMAQETDDRKAVFSCLGRLRKELCTTNRKSMQQTRIAQFYRTRENYAYS